MSAHTSNTAYTTSQRILHLLRMTCFSATVALAGCATPAAPPVTQQNPAPPSAVPAVPVAPIATAAARPQPSVAVAPVATAKPAPTSSVLPTATDLPTRAPTATLAPTAQATVQPVLSESNTRLSIPLPDAVTLFDFTISPDRQYVVYVAGSGSGERATVYSVPLHGGLAVALGRLDWQARSETYYREPYAQYVITPDSRAVIFQDADALYRVPIVGAAAQRLGTGLGAAGAAGPSTSESNRSLSNIVPDFRLYPACDCIIYRTATALAVLTLDGAPAMTLTETPGNASYMYDYAVSADGRWLVYDARRFDQWDEPKTPSWGGGLIKIVAVYSVPLSGGAALLVASAPTEDGAVSDYTISQNGRDLLFTTYADDGEGVTQAIRHWRVPLAGGTPVAGSSDS